MQKHHSQNSIDTNGSATFCGKNPSSASLFAIIGLASVVMGACYILLDPKIASFLFPVIIQSAIILLAATFYLRTFSLVVASALAGVMLVVFSMTGTMPTIDKPETPSKPAVIWQAAFFDFEDWADNTIETSLGWVTNQPGGASRSETARTGRYSLLTVGNGNGWQHASFVILNSHYSARGKMFSMKVWARLAPSVPANVEHQEANISFSGGGMSFSKLISVNREWQQYEVIWSIPFNSNKFAIILDNTLNTRNQILWDDISVSELSDLAKELKPAGSDSIVSVLGTRTPFVILSIALLFTALVVSFMITGDKGMGSLGRQYLFSRNGALFTVLISAFFTRLLLVPVPMITNAADGAGYQLMADAYLYNGWEAFFQASSYRTPGYPLFIAAIKALFGSYHDIALPWTQHLLGVVMAGLVFGIATRIFNTVVGLMAGLVVGTNMFIAILEHQPMSDFMAMLTVLVAIYFLVLGFVEKKWLFYILFSVAFAVSLEVRPLYQAFFPFVFAIVWWAHKSWRTAVGVTALAVTLSVLLALPWVTMQARHSAYVGLLPMTGMNLATRTYQYINHESDLRVKEKKIYQEMVKKYGPNQVSMIVWAAFGSQLGLSLGERDRALVEIGTEAILTEPWRYAVETVEEARDLLTCHSTTNLYSPLTPHRINKKFNAFAKSYYHQYADLQNPLYVKHQETIWMLTYNPKIFSLLFLLALPVLLIQRHVPGLFIAAVGLYALGLTAMVGGGTVARYQIAFIPFFDIIACYFVWLALSKLGGATWSRWRHRRLRVGLHNKLNLLL